MIRYEVLEHPADIGFRAHGRDLPELFANAALAMLSIAMEIEDFEARESYPIEATGGDTESLLVNWLNEVLYLADGPRIGFREITVVRLDEVSIAATGRGEPRDPQRHRSNLVVKAATYHQLKVAQDADGWFAEVYVDI